MYEADKVIPLPTYDQSQKYEQDGVLEIDEDEEPELTQGLSVMSKPPGTCLDWKYRSVSHYMGKSFMTSIIYLPKNCCKWPFSDMIK